MRNELLLSVSMVTFNHEKYIAQAIEGVLMQKCSFDFELVIGEDCSTDNTKKIILDFQKKYPKIIKPIFNKKNIGPNYNIIQLFNKSKGKYIAICDGDDYWTDENKLEKQLDHLETHPEISLCFHRTNILRNENSKLTVHSLPKPQPNYSFGDLIEHDLFVPSNSVIFLNTIKKFPKWFYKLPYGDIGIYFLVTRNANMGFLPEIMSIYRIHENGMWSQKDKKEQYKAKYEFFKTLFPYLKKSEKKIVKKKLIPMISKLAMWRFPNSKLKKICYENYLKINMKSFLLYNYFNIILFNISIHKLE